MAVLRLYLNLFEFRGFLKIFQILFSLGKKNSEKMPLKMLE